MTHKSAWILAREAVWKLPGMGSESAPGKEAIMEGNFNDMEIGVRPGDVFGLCVEYYYSAGMIEQCAQSINRMRAQNIPLNQYVDRKTIEDVLGAQDFNTDEVGEEIDEELHEELEEELEELEEDIQVGY